MPSHRRRRSSSGSPFSPPLLSSASPAHPSVPCCYPLRRHRPPIARFPPFESVIRADDRAAPLLLFIFNATAAPPHLPRFTYCITVQLSHHNYMANHVEPTTSPLPNGSSPLYCTSNGNDTQCTHAANVDMTYDYYNEICIDTTTRWSTGPRTENTVHLELLYCPFGMENEIINPFSVEKFPLTLLEKTLKSEGEDSEVAVPSTSWAKGVILRGALSVTVISAEDLPGMDLMGKTDPYVVLTIRKTGLRNKTRVLKKSLNPTWNETFDFVVEDAPHDLLMLEVYDHNTFGKEQIGECIMTLTRVLIEGEYSESVPLENAESGKLNLHLKWTPQPVYRDP